MDLPDKQKDIGRIERPTGPVWIRVLCPLLPLPDNLAALMNRKDIECSWVPEFFSQEKNDLFDHFDLVIFCPGKISDISQKQKLGKLLFLAQGKNLPIMFLTDDQTLINLIPVPNDNALPRTQTADPAIAADELWGRICTMLNFSPTFSRIEQYLLQLEKWVFSLNTRFEELNQELRLAWRVQQDFLPKKMPACGNMRFATLYRPKSWVSGDIYDIFQLDEENIGFSIADVVGHGVGAGLMTLFVKRAIITKEIFDHSYRIIPPDQALARLNDDLCSLELPEHQFVTGLYGIINARTGSLEISRAGHPHPIMIAPDGSIQAVEMEGTLLGVFHGTNFDKKQINLTPGTKLILFTDGLEQAFGNEDGQELMLQKFSQLANLPAQDFIESLTAELDCQENSLHPLDDITAVVIEYL